jgi:hypothetical protein
MFNPVSRRILMLDILPRRPRASRIEAHGRYSTILTQKDTPSEQYRPIEYGRVACSFFIHKA